MLLTHVQQPVDVLGDESKKQQVLQEHMIWRHFAILEGCPETATEAWIRGCTVDSSLYCLLNGLQSVGRVRKPAAMETTYCKYLFPHNKPRPLLSNCNKIVSWAHSRCSEILFVLLCHLNDNKMTQCIDPILIHGRGATFPSPSGGK